MTTTIGLLHPGEMGCAIGGELRRVGHRVLWASDGRGAETARRAAAADLEDARTATALAARCDIILSVCPPAAAAATADSVGPFPGIYVDANAIAPSTSREIGDRVRQRGAAYVDGGIVGPPPHHAGETRLYLSGESAGTVAALFNDTVIDAPVLGPRIGAASAIKVAYAAWTKGTTALLIAAHEFAVAEHVDDALEHEWSQSIPELTARLASAQRSASTKGWRWVAEMNEIADSFDAAGLPPGFHQAAAAIFERHQTPPSR